MMLDAITLSVIQAALQQVCDEMDLTFSRAAFSPVIAEANDRSDGIYAAADGALIAQGSGGLPSGRRLGYSAGCSSRSGGSLARALSGFARDAEACGRCSRRGKRKGIAAEPGRPRKRGAGRSRSAATSTRESPRNC